MEKPKLSLMILVIVTSIFSLIDLKAQTIYFEDNFERIVLTPGGSPETNYATSGTGNSTVNLNSLTVSEGNYLKFVSQQTGGIAGQLFLNGDISKFNPEFNRKLALNAVDSLMWTFNMRQNNNNTMTGFNSTQRGVGVILVADNSDLTVANGYAVVQTGTTASNSTMRLIKFTGGLNNTNIVVLINSLTVIGNSGRDYMSLKVTYSPASNTWKLYDRSDLTAWVDPTNTTGFNLQGSVTDNTFTSTTMSHFGFVLNHPASTVAFNPIFDNFKLAAYKTSTNTTANEIARKYDICTNHNGFSMVATDAGIVVYNVDGKVIVRKQVNGYSNILLDTKGIYCVAISTQNKSEIVKLIIK